MPSKIEKTIITHPKKCTGCQICQLICSYTYHQLYSPSKANIEVITHEYPPKISFRDECTHCFKCVQYCLYGALELEEVDA